MWADHSDFISIVEDGWSLNVEGTPQFKLCRKLKVLKSSLKAFNSLHYSHISVRVKEADLALQDAQLQLESNPGDPAVQDSLWDLRKKEFIAFYTSLLGIAVQAQPVDDDVFEWGAMLFLEHTSNVCRTVTPSETDFSPALEHLIDISQEAFVGGRDITNNIFLAQEMVQQYSRKRISPRCSINIDLSRAFDSISWMFLSRVFMGEERPRARRLDITDPIPSLHGVFFMTDQEKTSNSNFNFHPKCEKLKIIHLLFANNFMFFSGCDLPSIHILMKCLQKFKGISSLAINTSKSSIFTAGIQNDVLDGILARTKFARGDMSVRLQEWTAKSLSFAGRLELIHVVIQDKLWVKWVNEVYLRSVSLWDWQPKKGDSLLLRRLADIQDIVVTAFGSSEAAVQRMTEWSNIKGVETSKVYQYFRLKLTRQP
ncbi:hypothetical protein Sango_2853700 [Sesamum angolense]|uniref:Reverse transcriptase domain-containing protein n=1 Tax=Sesamum angolense TaxID=2727404 RepID=A0AAE1T718_9LAMI|nr:hypothetical protein Sango_2853700 [Sesamum angolense]